jgi:hypothetical protein
MRFSDAEKLPTGALESMEKSDTQSTQIPNYLRGLTSAYRAEGKLAEALAAAQRALEIELWVDLQREFGQPLDDNAVSQEESVSRPRQSYLP